jgi:hypothetical protein
MVFEVPRPVGPTVAGQVNLPVGPGEPGRGLEGTEGPRRLPRHGDPSVGGPDDDHAAGAALGIDEFGRYFLVADDGEADDDDRDELEPEEIFQYGQCHALALVLHHATGWPLVSLGNGSHFAVQAPDSRLVDITGAREKKDLEGTWGPAELTSAHDIWSLVHAVYMEPMDLGLACVYAPGVLDGLISPVPVVSPEEVRQDEPLTGLHLRLLYGAYGVREEGRFVPDLNDLGPGYTSLSDVTREQVLGEGMDRLVDEALLGRDDYGCWITDAGLGVLKEARWV